MSKENINIVDAIHLVAITIFTSLIDRYPIFKDLFINSGSTTQDWDFFVTAAGSGMVLMSPESFEGEHKQVMDRLIEIDANIPRAIDDFNKFMTKDPLPEELIGPMAGQWVLFNIKKSEPTEDETKNLAGVIGTMLIKVAQDNR
jgi:hypothetical protein